MIKEGDDPGVHVCFHSAINPRASSKHASLERKIVPNEGGPRVLKMEVVSSEEYNDIAENDEMDEIADDEPLPGRVGLVELNRPFNVSGRICLTY